MATPPFKFINTPEGEVVQISLRGRDVLSHPMTNFGTAFSNQDRQDLNIAGLLPSRVSTLEGQLRRTYDQYTAQPDALAKFLWLNALHDRNEVLYYRLLMEHLEEMLPIVYTPTIGQAIQEYSHWFQRGRGVYLSIDHPEDIEAALQAYGHGAEDVDLIVATDSEGILGIGDQGVGGVAITVGKLSVYIAAAGIHPRRVLPVVLDTGTDNLELLNDDSYLGERHSRVRGERYDAFIKAYVEAVHKLFPKAMLHFEDFGAGNAHRVLNEYRDDYCAFNDDIQGTAAVVVAAALSAIAVSKVPLPEQKIVIHGAGTAGVGIADLLCDIMVSKHGMSREDARKRFFCLGSRGLIREGVKARDFQQPYMHESSTLAGWKLANPDRVDLFDVVANVHPTMMIGTSAQPGDFSEQIVREMAEHAERPIIMPLSNPTSLAEALPTDLLEWTNGKALIATGSPFDPVVHNGTTYTIAQANNALVFPGIGLGVVVCGATRISDEMIAAAAEAVAMATSAWKEGASLLPGIDELRLVSSKVALAVIGAAQAQGLASIPLEDPIQAVCDAMWRPEYPIIQAV